MTHFEEAVFLLNAEMLIVPGVLSVLVGLWLWLGGSLFKRTAMGFMGVLVGAVAGFVMVRNQAALISSAGCGLLGMAFWRLCAGLVAGLLSVILVFIVIGVLQGDALDKHDSEAGMSEYDAAAPDNQGETLTDRWIALVNTIWDYALSLPSAVWLTLVVVYGGTAFFSWLWPRLGLAACCAQAGTLLIWTGMVLLLIYKGVMPLSWMCLRPVFFLAGYGLMVAFGTVEQAFIYTEKHFYDNRDEDRRHIKKRRHSKGY